MVFWPNFASTELFSSRKPPEFPSRNYSYGYRLIGENILLTQGGKFVAWCFQMLFFLEKEHLNHLSWSPRGCSMVTEEPKTLSLRSKYQKTRSWSGHLGFLDLLGCLWTSFHVILSWSGCLRLDLECSCGVFKGMLAKKSQLTAPLMCED